MPRRRPLVLLLRLLLLLLAAVPHRARAQHRDVILLPIPLPDPADPLDRVGSWSAVDGDVDRAIPSGRSRIEVDSGPPSRSASHKMVAQPFPPRDSR